MPLPVVTAGVLRTMKSTFAGGEHTPHNILDVPDQGVTLLTAADSDGEWQDWAGGTGALAIWGEGDGAVAQFEYRTGEFDDPVPVGPSLAVFPGGFLGAELPICEVRVSIIDAGSSTALYAKFKRTG